MISIKGGWCLVLYLLCMPIIGKQLDLLLIARFCPISITLLCLTLLFFHSLDIFYDSFTPRQTQTFILKMNCLC